MLALGTAPLPEIFVAAAKLAMVAIVFIVIAVIPVVLGVPTMLVFIPPTMVVVPAVIARFPQFVTRTVRLLALASVMLDGFMKMMVRLGDSLLATVVITAQTWSAGEEKEPRQRSAGQRYFSHAKNSYFSRPKNSGLNFCMHPVLLYV
jgi:hypothetical protein